MDPSRRRTLGRTARAESAHRESGGIFLTGTFWTFRAPAKLPLAKLGVRVHQKVHVDLPRLFAPLSLTMTRLRYKVIPESPKSFLEMSETSKMPTDSASEDRTVRLGTIRLVKIWYKLVHENRLLRVRKHSLSQISHGHFSDFSSPSQVPIGQLLHQSIPEDAH
jgi:hypothetical protein